MPETKSLVLKKEEIEDGFARRIGWEIPKGSFVFIEGKDGTGKSIICQRLCYSFLENDNACSYLSTQFTVKSFVRQMSSVGYGVRRYLLRGQFFFISTESILAETLPKETFLDKLLGCKRLFESEIIFIDSISNLLNESINDDNVLDLLSFFNRWMGVGKIIVVTANPHEWENRFHHKLKVNSDIHYELAIKDIPGIGPVHQLHVHKFSGAQRRYNQRTQFTVKPKSGIAVESTHVAF